MQEMKEAAGEDERELAEEMSKAFMSEELPDEVFGSPKAGAGMWASMIRIISPVKGNTVAKIPFEQNEAAHRFVVAVVVVCSLYFSNFCPPPGFFLRVKRVTKIFDNSCFCVAYSAFYAVIQKQVGHFYYSDNFNSYKGGPVFIILSLLNSERVCGGSLN